MAIEPVTAASALKEKLLSGNPRALSHAITLVENSGEGSTQLLAQLDGCSSGALVVGFTGAPGVGKSTLIDAYITRLRAENRRVAVVSIDPSSPLSGGAILGDRLRMAGHIGDEGVYIRSCAARGHLGGLVRNIKGIVTVIDAAKWDVIVLETVGTGQSEVEVSGIAQVCVVVTCPGMGDEIQAMKSGVLDIADVLVVNKADLPGASKTAASLRGMLKLREESRQAVPVIELSATQGTGISELVISVSASRRKAA